MVGDSTGVEIRDKESNELLSRIDSASSGRRHARVQPLPVSASAWELAATSSGREKIDYAIIDRLWALGMSGNSVWPAWSLYDATIVFQSSQGRDARSFCLFRCCAAAVAKCGCDPSTGVCPRILSLAGPVVAAVSKGSDSLDYTWGNAEDFGLEGAEVLVIRYDPRVDSAACIVSMAVHEDYHLRVQHARNVEVPLEYAPAISTRLPNGAKDYNSFIQKQYSKMPTVQAALERETQLLLSALLAAEKRSPLTVELIRAFLAARKERRSSHDAIPGAEDILEREEGVAVLIELRAERYLAERLKGDKERTCGLITSGRDEFQKGTVIGPSFAFTGGLQLAILDEISDRSATAGRWMSLLFPGRSESAIAITEILSRAEGELEHN